jgi:RNA polymerase sigma factor (sigma-70 family)
MSMDRTLVAQLWQGSLAQSVAASQRWVLAAMQQNGPGLVTMLWRILGSEHDVCDAYQDTFLHLANHFEGRRRPDNIRSYLYQTAMNTAISMLRRRRLQQNYQQALRQEAAVCRPVDYGRPIDARALQEDLRKAIARLPEYLANVVVLRDLAELPYAEVGRALGISTAAARVYRHKAIQVLASMMAEKE